MTLRALQSLGRTLTLTAAALTLVEARDIHAATYSGQKSELQVAPPRLEEDVRVDGVLDEPVWEKAALLSDFSQYAPSDGRPADDATVVRVWYSPTAIHFGIQARAVPGSVRSTLANRDRIDADDHVQIFLSTFNDGRQALVFAVNPLGVQADGALAEGTSSGGGGFAGLSTAREAADLSPDYVFESKGRLTDDGYEVEVRIPFKSLRYQPKEPQDWGLHVVRKVQSTGHEESWAPARRAAASFLQQSGTLTGLTGLRRGLVLDLTPVLTSRVDGAAGPNGWRYDAARPEPGGNVRWGVTPNLTLNGTVNPDFSQVESDAGQFSYDPRSAVFFPEKRPFFLEAIEQFTTPNSLIYTRRVTSPIGAAKLTGKISGTTVAFLSAVDDRAGSTSGEDHPFYNLLRVQRDVGAQSKLALVYTDRIDGERSNRVAGLDARIPFRKIYSLQLQAAVSRTHETDTTFTAPLWQAIFSRNGRRFGLRWMASGIHDDFRAESGFIGRGGLARVNLDERVTFFGREGSRFESLSTDLVLDGNWKYPAPPGQGGFLEKKLHINNNATLRGGWRLGASILIETFGYDPDLYADYALQGVGPRGETVVQPFVGTPDIDNLDYVLSVDTPRWKAFSGHFDYLWGRDENFFEWAPSDIAYMTVQADWRPSEKLRVNGQYLLQRFARRTDGSVAGQRRIPRLKVEYQATRAIFVRLVGEYDARERDALRDDSRTDLPILIRDPLTGVYAPARASRRNDFRLDALFSYQPTPGTVIFAGYGAALREREAFRLSDLSRASDGFFFKISYLFRL